MIYLVFNGLEENVHLHGRINNSYSKLFKMLGKKARIIDMRYDGKALLEMCDVFVGSGGTMTAEAHLWAYLVSIWAYLEKNLILLI